MVELVLGPLLRYVGTMNAARDMDVLRAALGQAKLTYLGKSYGTYLGAWYAQLFPHRVRALVLDGAFDPDTPALQDDMIQAQGLSFALPTTYATARLAQLGHALGDSLERQRRQASAGVHPQTTARQEALDDGQRPSENRP